MLYVEQVMQNLHWQLLDLEHLEPNQFASRCQYLSGSGFEEGLVVMIRQSVNEFRNQRSIMKYIYIVDQLLKLPTFVNAIHIHLAELYSDIFIFLLIQKCHHQIEELKILRKYWLAKIHPLVLEKIKQTVYHQTQIDIDTGFKPETINKITNFYTSKLKLSPYEITIHLPQLRLSYDEYRITPVSQQSFHPQIYYQAPLSQPAPYYPQKSYENSYIGYSQSIKNYPNVQAEKIFVVPKEKQDLKRKRFTSEQTKAMDAMQEIIENCKPRKIVHKSQVIGYRQMLLALEKSHPFRCKECSIQFCTKKNYENHQVQHLKAKFHSGDKNKGTSRKGLMNAFQWVGQQQILPNDKFCIAVKNMGQTHEYICNFCCCPINLEFKQDEWTLVNATVVKIEAKTVLIHKHCQLALQSSSQEQSDFNLSR